MRDTFDGVDLPLIVFEARVGVAIEVSAAIVKVGASGGVTIRVEIGELHTIFIIVPIVVYLCRITNQCHVPVQIDLYDPFPETSQGLVRPFELLAMGSTPLDWFEITLTVTIRLSVYIKIGIYIGFVEITLFTLRRDFSFVILGPLKRIPDVSSLSVSRKASTYLNEYHLCITTYSHQGKG